MTSRPLVLLVADSLRFDSVWLNGDHRLPWTAAHAVRYHQARSAGCWTLPATASMFTGLYPHQHGATEQTRGIRPVPTLAEQAKARGYSSHMVTANVATTEVFGLDRGFDTVDRIWQQVEARHRRIHQILVLAGKPRLREKLFSKDFIVGKLSEDIDMAKTWLQDTDQAIFDRTRERLVVARRAGKPAFIFVNLMETHFPYHVADTFQTLADSPYNAVREVLGLFHLVNQTWMTDDRRTFIPPDVMATLRRRQRVAWERLAPRLDAFVEELVSDWGAVVAVGADHGETFGEHGHSYHFANIHDAGNRVPWFYVDTERAAARDEHTPVSTKDLYGTLLASSGQPDPSATDLLVSPELSLPLIEACWYNNRGRTLSRFRRNQLAFVAGDVRYAWRGDRWASSPITLADAPESPWSPLPFRSDPLRDGAIDSDTRLALQPLVDGFTAFASTLPTA